MNRRDRDAVARPAWIKPRDFSASRYAARVRYAGRRTELGVSLATTLSCMNPRDRVDCGLSSKCRERRDAFAEASVPDPTEYRPPSPKFRVQGG